MASVQAAKFKLEPGAGNPVFIQQPAAENDGQMQDVVSVNNSGQENPRLQQRRASPSKSPGKKAHTQRQVNAAAAKKMNRQV